MIDFSDFIFFFQAEDGIRDVAVTGVQTCALPISNVVGLSTNANLGPLREIAGAANKLVIQPQPSSTATAGVPFAQQPLIQVQDRFGNVRNAANSGGAGDNSTVVTAASTAGSGALQGATSLTPLNGVVVYTNLSHTVATNFAIIFTGTNLSSATST